MNLTWFGTVEMCLVSATVAPTVTIQLNSKGLASVQQGEWEWGEHHSGASRGDFQSSVTLGRPGVAGAADELPNSRAGRYPARGSFNEDRRLLPCSGNADLFKPGKTSRLVVENLARQLPFTGGRISLRQMLGGESRYDNGNRFSAP